MKIRVISCFYNEEFLVPFFLSHYSFADRIEAVVTPGTDNTLFALGNNSKVLCTFVDFPNGVDDGKLRDVMNARLNDDEGFDWTIMVDSDEFVWPSGIHFPQIREHVRKVAVESFLETVHPSDQVLMANMWQVYRNEKDVDLDPSIEPVILQRRHGDLNRETGGNEGYRKPAIIRAGYRIRTEVGGHRLQKTLPQPRISTSCSFEGAHWAFADPCFAVKRRTVDRRDRQSQENYRTQRGTHVWKVTDEEILARCESHKHDPQLF